MRDSLKHSLALIDAKVTKMKQVVNELQDDGTAKARAKAAMASTLPELSLVTSNTSRAFSTPARRAEYDSCYAFARGAGSVCG